jgi:hypothetical protein
MTFFSYKIECLARSALSPNDQAVSPLHQPCKPVANEVAINFQSYSIDMVVWP